MAAFAQQLTVYESPRAFAAEQARQGLDTPSRSFIPSGLVSPSGEPVTPPEPHALISGHVLEAAVRANTISGTPYWWALVESVGGTFDVVIDPELLPNLPQAGKVLVGLVLALGPAARRRTAPPVRLVAAPRRPLVGAARRARL